MAKEILERHTVVFKEDLFKRWVWAHWHQPVSLH